MAEMSISLDTQRSQSLHDSGLLDKGVSEGLHRPGLDRVQTSSDDNTSPVDAKEKDDSDSPERDLEPQVSGRGRGAPASSYRKRNAVSEPYTAAEERTILHKFDRRLTLLLCGLYLLSFLDRSNIGNAKVAGLQTSLGITDSQFDLTLVAFYVTYITFQWTILLYRLVPPHIYIACCVFAWGLVACLQATITSFTQLLVLRAALGMTEAAFSPGLPFYMTFFYRREELAYRVGLQISAAPLATSFASSLAWVIVKASENSPLESWRALFLFEGFPSLIAAFFAFYNIPDSPAQTKWLTPRERQIASLRLNGSDSRQPFSTTATRPLVSKSASSVGTKLNSKDLIETLKDPHAYLMSLMFLSVNVSFASLPVFLPTIINDMSFSPLTSQILAAPPYLVAFVFVLLIARASDRIVDSRGIFLSSCAGLSCASYLVIAVTGALSRNGRLGDTTSVVVRYVAVYGAACGLFASVVLIITWQLNNQRSTSGKGLAMVILNLVGQTGPLIGVQLFPGPDAPYFVKGMAVCSVFMGFVAVFALALRRWLALVNRGCSECNRAYEAHQYEMVGLTSGHGDGDGDGDGDEILAENDRVTNRGDGDGESSDLEMRRHVFDDNNDDDEDDEDDIGHGDHGRGRATDRVIISSGTTGFKYML